MKKRIDWQTVHSAPIEHAMNDPDVLAAIRALSEEARAGNEEYLTLDAIAAALMIAERAVRDRIEQPKTMKCFVCDEPAVVICDCGDGVLRTFCNEHACGIGYNHHGEMCLGCQEYQNGCWHLDRMNEPMPPVVE